MLQAALLYTMKMCTLYCNCKFYKFLYPDAALQFYFKDISPYLENKDFLIHFPSWTCYDLALVIFISPSNSLMYPKLITGKRVALIVAMVYFISLTISMPPVLGWGKQQFVKGVCSLPYSPGYVIYSAIGSFYLPFIVMSVLYCKIYKVRFV